MLTILTICYFFFEIFHRDPQNGEFIFVVLFAGVMDYLLWELERSPG